MRAYACMDAVAGLQWHFLMQCNAMLPLPLPMHSSWLGGTPCFFDFDFWACWIPFGRGIVLCNVHWGEGPSAGNVLRHGALSFGVQEYN